MKPEKKPYKVIVWGPGTAGGAVIKEVLKRPELELVGVLAFSDSKNGVDAGESVGVSPCGVKMTTDKQTIFDMQADVVLHSTQAPLVDTSAVDADVVKLLESGKNVISCVSYHFPPQRGEEHVKMLEDACAKGGVSLHGTGVHPAFIVERLAVTLTGFTNDVEHIHIEEFADNSAEGNSITSLMAGGHGQPPEYFVEGNEIWDVAGRYYWQALDAAAEMLWGKRFDRFETAFSPIYAKEEEVHPAITIAKGHCSSSIHSYSGYMGDEKKMTITEHWFLGKQNAPEGINSRTHHRITVEGSPASVQVNMETKASINDNLEVREGDSTPAIYYATTVPMIQAIPKVCSAEPGLVYQSVFSHHADDLRRLA